MFNLCTEFTASGICLLYVLRPVLFYLLFFNTFVTNESMYIVVMIEKKSILCQLKTLDNSFTKASFSNFVPFLFKCNFPLFKWFLLILVQ